jgi:2,3-bisphosphoglycerate-dependent phosphoglycerate mutase
MHTLVLIRHGQSIWNLNNHFTGWTDVPLSRHGRAEAMVMGRLLKENGYHFDVAYTSVQRSATLGNKGI